jgi:(2R)-sulfolactate sulfo-lyase subunit alpha
MIQFIAHGKQDNVAVMVMDVRKDEQIVGWNMETDETLRATATEDIPLGHKIALARVAKGEKVIKYNVPIGDATQDISVGQHVHTHCLRTARW